jgi:ketosteroid isomerase-like protein
MKKSLVFFLAICFCSASSSAQVKVQEAISDLVNVFNAAIIATDSLALVNLTHNDLSYSHSSGVIQDKPAFIAGVMNGPNFFRSFELKDQTIRISGKNAIVRHVATAQAINNGKPVEIKFGNLMIWQKSRGKWVLLARQGYKL